MMSDEVEDLPRYSCEMSNCLVLSGHSFAEWVFDE